MFFLCLVPFRWPRHLVLHLIHLADVSPGQLRAAEDVPGEGTLAAPLPRNDREGQARQSQEFPHLCFGRWPCYCACWLTQCLFVLWQDILDNSSNGIPQISYNGHTAASPWWLNTNPLLLLANTACVPPHTYTAANTATISCLRGETSDVPICGTFPFLCSEDTGEAGFLIIMQKTGSRQDRALPLGR